MASQAPAMQNHGWDAMAPQELSQAPQGLLEPGFSETHAGDQWSHTGVEHAEEYNDSRQYEGSPAGSLESFLSMSSFGKLPSAGFSNASSASASSVQVVSMAPPVRTDSVQVVSMAPPVSPSEVQVISMPAIPAPVS